MNITKEIEFRSPLDAVKKFQVGIPGLGSVTCGDTIRISLVCQVIFSIRSCTQYHASIIGLTHNVKSSYFVLKKASPYQKIACFPWLTQSIAC
jgi:hypothetical protein